MTVRRGSQVRFCLIVCIVALLALFVDHLAFTGRGRQTQPFAASALSTHVATSGTRSGEVAREVGHPTDFFSYSASRNRYAASPVDDFRALWQLRCYQYHSPRFHIPSRTLSRLAAHCKHRLAAAAPRCNFSLRHDYESAAVIPAGFGEDMLLPAVACLVLALLFQGTVIH